MRAETDHQGHELPGSYSGMGMVAGMPRPGLTLQKFQHFFLYIGVFTVSWHIFRPGELNFTFSDASFLIVLISLIASSRLNMEPMGSLSPAWLFSLFLMLVALFVSTILNGDLVRWLIVATQYSFAYLLLPMMFVSLDRKTLQRCVVIYILGVCTSQAIGNIANIFLDYTDTAPYLGPNFITGLGRVAAFSGNANNNGAMTGFAMVFLLYAVDRKLLPPLLSIICAIFLMWGLIASASFGGFVICLSAVTLVLIIRWPKQAIFGLLAGAIVVTSYIGSDLPLPGPFEDRVVAAFTGGGLAQAGTYVGRAELVQEAWRIAGDTLFLGLGADGFRVASVYQAPVHVLPLLLLTEAGLPGLIGFLGLLAILWFKTLAVFSTDTRRSVTCVGVLLIFTLFTLTVPHMYARLWVAPVFLALSVCFSFAHTDPRMSLQKR